MLRGLVICLELPSRHVSVLQTEPAQGGWLQSQDSESLWFIALKSDNFLLCQNMWEKLFEAVLTQHETISPFMKSRDP